MLIEKIRTNGGKISFFLLSVFAVVGGVFYLRSQDLEKKVGQKEELRADELDAIKRQAVEAATLKAQEYISADRKEKLDSIANNPKETTVAEPVTVTKTIPAETKKVAVPAESTSTKTSTSTKKTKSS